MRRAPAGPRRTGPATRSGAPPAGSIRLAAMLPSGRRNPLTAIRSPTRGRGISGGRPAVTTVWPSTVSRSGAARWTGPTTSWITAMPAVASPDSPPTASVRTTWPTRRSATPAGRPSIVTGTSGG